MTTTGPAAAVATELPGSGSPGERPRHRARVRRLDPAALRGVLVREIINFSSYWRGTTFSSTVEPTVYLLAFGFGMGAILADNAGFDYIDFLGTGTVGTAVLFASAMPAMFGTFVKYKFQRTYDAILAAPVDTEELVTAEAMWLGVRAGVFGCAPLLVAVFFGLDPGPWIVVIPLINFIAGFGWACFGICVAAYLEAMENFNYVTSGFLTPVMLTAGTFFPIDRLPDWAQILAWFNPLHHAVELVRHATFGWDWPEDLAHLGLLIVFAVILWRVAVRGMTKRLIT